MSKLQTLNPNISAQRYRWKGNKKQKMAMEYWLDPSSETFGNAYRSWLKAGFSPSYSKNITNLAPNYLSEYLERIDFNETHIKQALQSLAISAPNSRSPDDTRLKSLELLMKLEGLGNDKSTTNITLVQPILGGQSTNPPIPATDEQPIDAEYSETIEQPK